MKKLGRTPRPVAVGGADGDGKREKLLRGERGEGAKNQDDGYSNLVAL